MSVTKKYQNMDENLKVDFQWELKPKYDILFYVVLIILWGKIKISTNNKISYFGFYFDWKSTSSHVSDWYSNAVSLEKVYGNNSI